MKKVPRGLTSIVQQALQQTDPLKTDLQYLQGGRRNPYRESPRNKQFTPGFIDL